MECQGCQKRFSSKQRLQYHVQKKVCFRTTATGLDCPECGKAFTTKRRLQYHVQRKVCRKPSLNLSCPECGREFASRQKLDYHVDKAVCAKAYGPELPKECSFCNVIFEDDSVAVKHLRYCRPCYCGDKKWHEQRCGKHHSWPVFQQRDLRKKEIDAWFGLDPPFDDFKPFDQVSHWKGKCEDCGNMRDTDEHIRGCVVAEHVERCRKTYGNSVAKRLAAKLKAGRPSHPRPVPSTTPTM